MKHSYAVRCRGSIYIVVLSVSILVMVIGLSAVAAARLRMRVVNADHDLAASRYLARSTMDIAMHRLANNANWRNTYVNDVWTASETLAQAEVEFKLVDEVDGDLADDPDDPARLYVRATVDNAARLFSVLVQSQLDNATPNLLRNPGMENGAAGWFVPDREADLQVYSDDVHSGGWSLLAADRDEAWAGPWRDITTQITSGKTYYIEAWTRMAPAEGGADIKITIQTKVGASTSHFNNPGQAVTNAGWTKLTTTLTPSWAGSLDQAMLYLETQSPNKNDFLTDDVLMIRSASAPTRRLQVVAGSWRQETLP